MIRPWTRPWMGKAVWWTVVITGWIGMVVILPRQTHRVEADADANRDVVLPIDTVLFPAEIETDSYFDVDEEADRRAYERAKAVLADRNGRVLREGFERAGYSLDEANARACMATVLAGMLTIRYEQGRYPVADPDSLEAMAEDTWVRMLAGEDGVLQPGVRDLTRRALAILREQRRGRLIETW